MGQSSVGVSCAVKRLQIKQICASTGCDEASARLVQLQLRVEVFLPGQTLRAVETKLVDVEKLLGERETIAGTLHVSARRFSEPHVEGDRGKLQVRLGSSDGHERGTLSERPVQVPFSRHVRPKGHCYSISPSIPPKSPGHPLLQTSPLHPPRTSPSRLPKGPSRRL